MKHVKCIELATKIRIAFRRIQNKIRDSRRFINGRGLRDIFVFLFRFLVNNTTNMMMMSEILQ